jgi:RNA polymerase sigma-70 factor (ECF subfamily)
MGAWDMKMDLEEDDALIHRAVYGETAALEYLLESNAQRLWRYVDKQLPQALKQSIDPSDIVQDTFYEACRLIAGFALRGEDCFFRWLATIARHRIIDILRAHKTRRVEGAQSLAEEEGDVVALLQRLGQYRRTPSRSAAAHEFMIAVEAAIGRLPEDHRCAVTLRHLEGLSADETARRMDRSTEAVYWMCSRGLKALRTDLRSASYFV